MTIRVLGRTNIPLLIENMIKRDHNMALLVGDRGDKISKISVSTFALPRQILFKILSLPQPNMRAIFEI